MVLGTLFIALLTAAFPAVTSRPLPLTTDQVVSRMLEQDEARRAALQNYVSVRHYALDNKRFHKRAEMTVRVTYTSPGTKSFTVVSEKGSGFIRRKVLQKMIEAEVEAAKEENGDRSRIIPKNYDFELLGTEQEEGRPSYVLQIAPKTANKFLIRGRIWVDAEDFAIIRVEGSPAKNPSFWTSRIQVKHEYEKHAPFWLPRSNFSRSEVRIFGPTELTIDYLEYQINAALQNTGANE
jgi:hypothetical protein